MAKMLPHDGRMILGGKGSLTPFNPSQTSSSETKPQNTARPDPMAPAMAYENQGSEIAMAVLPIDLGEYIRALIDARLRRFPNETRKCRMLQIIQEDKVRIAVEVREDMVLVDRMQRHVKWKEVCHVQP